MGIGIIAQPRFLRRKDSSLASARVKGSDGPAPPAGRKPPW